MPFQGLGNGILETYSGNPSLHITGFFVCSELIPHERAHSVNFPWQMMTTNFGLNTDGTFQCVLSILGQFPAFLAHTTVHRALSITVPLKLPLCEALYWSFLWSSLPD